MVLLRAEPEEVLAVGRLSTKATEAEQVAGEKQFALAVGRARLQARTMRDFVEEHDPDFISIESFVDLASRAGREDKKRWTTPLVIGMMDAELRDLGVEDRVRYQNPSVLAQFRSEMSALKEANSAPGKRKESVLLPGDELISNSHLISAFAHASWRVARI